MLWKFWGEGPIPFLRSARATYQSPRSPPIAILVDSYARRGRREGISFAGPRPSTFVLSHSEIFLNPQFYCPQPPLPATLALQAGGFPLSGSERRTTQRFQMRLPLTVRWTTGAAVGETATESRDVSSRGVYFFLSKDVREGSPVEILLTLPNEITLAGPVRVRCLGRVQRTEPREEGAIGVVAAIERYEFLRGHEDIRQ
jgi:hypothetical protein